MKISRQRIPQRETRNYTHNPTIQFCLVKKLNIIQLEKKTMKDQILSESFYEQTICLLNRIQKRNIFSIFYNLEIIFI